MPRQISISSRECPAALSVRQLQRKETCNQSHCGMECECPREYQDLTGKGRDGSDREFGKGKEETLGIKERLESRTNKTNYGGYHNTFSFRALPPLF